MPVRHGRWPRTPSLAVSGTILPGRRQEEAATSWRTERMEWLNLLPGSSLLPVSLSLPIAPLTADLAPAAFYMSFTLRVAPAVGGSIAFFGGREALIRLTRIVSPSRVNALLARVQALRNVLRFGTSPLNAHSLMR